MNILKNTLAIKKQIQQMAKKKPVNLTIQTIYIFIPILSLIALYRVEKLRWGILIAILFSLVGWSIDFSFGVDDDAFVNFFISGANTLYGILYLILIATQVAVFIYLIRKWSREWNNKDEVKAWNEDLE